MLQMTILHSRVHARFAKRTNTAICRPLSCSAFFVACSHTFPHNESARNLSIVLISWHIFSLSCEVAWERHNLNEQKNITRTLAKVFANDLMLAELTQRFC